MTQETLVRVQAFLLQIAAGAKILTTQKEGTTNTTMKRRIFSLVLILAACAGISLAQQPVNHVQVGGTAVSTGNGTAGAGVQRVTIASDNTAFAVNATPAVCPASPLSF